MTKIRALIDGDMFPYECGALTKKPVEDGKEDNFPHIQVGEVFPFEVCWGVVQNKIDTILQETGATNYTIFLSSREIPTWRFEAATILPYKGNRKSEKPVHWELILENLKIHYKCEVVEFIEADDAMSIAQYDAWLPLKVQDTDAVAPTIGDVGTIICSRDKDLGMVPGWHYHWAVGKNLSKIFYRTRIEGLREFYKQILTGDRVDNILGLAGVGDKAACVQRVMKYETEQEMLTEVYDAYKDRFGNYAKQFLLETGQLLWMQMSREDRWNPFEERHANRWGH